MLHTRRTALALVAVVVATASIAAAGIGLVALAKPPKTGGCCLPSGACVVVTQANCTAQGGTYRGNGTNCSTPCAPTGACCLPNGSCAVLTQANCSAQGGTYQGNGTSCSPNPCPQPPAPITAHGVLVQSVSDLNCFRFESDTGDWFILSNSGSFAAGDRIYVEGTVPQNTAGICQSELAPFITVSLLRPGFAGIGTIITVTGQKRLQTADGRVYGLQNNGGFSDGTSVYVQGSVITSQSPPLITSNVIGAPFSGFGRLLGYPPGDKRILAEDGVTYALDRVAAHNAAATDYLYVEGILGAPGNPRPVTSAVARPAFTTSGEVIDNGSGGKAFQAHGVIVDDVFSVSGIDAFALGATVYVRGLTTNDYDYLEPRNGNSIRQPRVGTGYTALGAINVLARTVTNVDDGTVINLENTGGFPDGYFVYVAGEVSATGPGSVTLSHNLVLIGLELNGDLRIGFECAPLFISGGGAFFLENNGGYPIDSNVTVRGGIGRGIAPCEFDCFVNNSIILGLPDR